MNKKRGAGGLTPIGELIPEILPAGLPRPDAPAKDVPLSKRVAKRSGRIVAVRESREQGQQRVHGELTKSGGDWSLVQASTVPAPPVRIEANR